MFALAAAPTAIMCWLARETIAHLKRWAWSYREPDPADTGGLLGYLPAILAMCLRALAVAPLLAWGQVNKVGDSRGSLRASLACVTQPCWVPRKMLAGQGNVYACAVV